MAQILDWIDHHEATAAWVQAVGAILALLVAIGVPAWQRWVERRDREADRKLRARSLAIAIFPTLLNLAEEVRKARGLLAEPLGNTPLNKFAAAGLKVPDLLVQSADRLNLFGQRAGLPTQQVIAFLGDYSRMVQSVIWRGGGSTPINFEEERTRLIEQIDMVKKLVDESISRVRPIHNGEE